MFSGGNTGGTARAGSISGFDIAYIASTRSISGFCTLDTACTASISGFDTADAASTCRTLGGSVLLGETATTSRIFRPLVLLIPRVLADLWGSFYISTASIARIYCEHSQHYCKYSKILRVYS